MDRVTLPGWLLAVICAGLALSLLALAFLLGRESGRGGGVAASPPGPAAPVSPAAVAVEPAAPSQVAAPTQVVAPAPTQPEPVATRTVRPSEPGAVVHATSAAPPPLQGTAARPVEQPHTRVVVSEKPTVADSGEKAAVAAYFAQVDNIHPGSFSGSPEQLAQEILNGASTGDMSGIDKMIRQAREAETTARSINPPAPCSEVHQESVKVLHESVQMLVSLRAALAQGDVNQLQSFQSAATSLKSRTEALERRQQALRSKYGVPAAKQAGT